MLDAVLPQSGSRKLHIHRDYKFQSKLVYYGLCAKGSFGQSQTRNNGGAMKLLAILLCLSAYAEDIYVSQSGAGSGLSCADSRSISWLNTAANWGGGSGEVDPGDTVHLCGDITSQIVIQTSGTSGNVITVYFEPGAKMTSPAWPGPSTSTSAGAIVVSKKNYITIDGGSNGVIENTDNGTGLGNQVDSVGVNGNGNSFFVVKNLTISNIYVRTTGTEQVSAGNAISNTNKSGGAFSNVRFTGNTIHDVGIGIRNDYDPSGASDIEIDHNTIYSVNWGANVGSRNTGSTCTRVQFHDNTVYGFSNWDDTSASNTFHHNAFFGWASHTSATLTEVDVYSNTIGPGFGLHSTSGVFFQYFVDAIRIYNNVFIAALDDYPSNGLVFLDPYSSVPSSHGVYNNTFIGEGSGTAVGVSLLVDNTQTVTLHCKNNLISGVATAIAIFSNTGFSGDIDYNLGYNLFVDRPYSYSASSSSSAKTFAQWQGLGFDVHGLSADPVLTGSYMLTAGSPAIGAGANLSSLGITALNSDKNGVLRGSSWDLGALEYAAPPPLTTTGGMVLRGLTIQ